MKNIVQIHGEAYVNDYKFGTIYIAFGIFKWGGWWLINLESFVLVFRPSLKTDCMWAVFTFSF